MKFCEHCGNQLLDEAIMCPKCGKNFSEEKAADTANKNKRTLGAILCLMLSFGIIIGTIIAVAYQLG